jgi:septal ring factor EnvC (AmiA/AmiB activator)
MNNFKDEVEKITKKHIYNWDGYLSNAITDISTLHDKEMAGLEQFYGQKLLEIADINGELERKIAELKSRIKLMEEASIKNGEIIAEADTEIIKLKKQLDQLKVENEKLQESLGITIHWISQQKFPNKFELSKLTRKDK